MVRIRRTVVASVLCVVLLTSAPVTASGGKDSRRTIEGTYTGPAAISTPDTEGPHAFIGFCNPPDPDNGCVRIPLKKKDRFFTVEIKDATGLAVYAVVFDHNEAEVDDVCGKTEAPLASPGGPYIDVWIAVGSCFDEVQPTVPTEGDVVVTFARKRKDLSQ